MAGNKTKTSIQKVARQAGVSTATVSRVFNKHPYVNPATYQRVLAAAKKLQYFPPGLGKRNAVAIMTDSIMSSAGQAYISPMLAALVAHLVIGKYPFQIITSQNIDELYENGIRFFVAIIHDRPALERIREIKNIAGLVLNELLPPFPSICSDHSAGVEEAVKYLVHSGHRRIALFVGENDQSWGGRARYQGYIRALRANGIAFDELLVEEMSHAECIEATARLMRRNPTALIICGEPQALPVTHALEVLDKKIPDDISVISFENPAISRYLWPPHTTIFQNFDAIAGAALQKIDMFFKEGKQDKKNIIVPNILIERQSVRRINPAGEGKKTKQGKDKK